jgi:hypothetical protein
MHLHIESVSCKNGHKLSREKLREIFESVRSGEIDFDEFLACFENY